MAETPRAPVPGLALTLMVALGGMLGACARWGLGVWLHGGSWPWATLAANVLGSFLIGLVAALTLPGGRWRWSPAWQQFWVTGIFGGFTTFSLFSLEALAMFQAQAWGLAGAYILVSVGAWLLAVVAGYALGQHFNPRDGTL
ncbi:hypothetical protein A167_00735 [Alcanivorax sp. S71-1-4]|uniref:fluoride efflux transporter FluC n=1 Tax=Alcanivorax sp. S71-1-4 TaxID=1177159 RepID=UPI00169A5C2F|nr:CrcB family protein [Alcanivorax sp. S71-1-4]KAF0810455.1 hypothetical protein A167_00735 [Alcanivorax sp. S71-1-4]